MRQRWIHPQKARYYQVDLVQDLLGDWTLVLSWGGLTSRRGQLRIRVVPSEAAGRTQLEAIAKRRQRRGYVLSGDAAEEAALIRRALTAATPERARRAGPTEPGRFRAPGAD